MVHIISHSLRGVADLPVAVVTMLMRWRRAMLVWLIVVVYRRVLYMRREHGVVTNRMATA